jgi:hypothetical protein
MFDFKAVEYTSAVLVPPKMGSLTSDTYCVFLGRSCLFDRALYIPLNICNGGCDLH